MVLNITRGSSSGAASLTIERAVLPLAPVLATAPGPVAETSYGKVLGEQRGDVLVFRGIPYATPPLGPLRFRAPVPPEPWTGVREDTAFGPAALQGVLPVPEPVPASITFDVGPTGEDCLYLNVFTPSTAGMRPVMVWVHGGGFLNGAGSERLYDGAPLARRGDAVVVTLNYRLGIFGFLHGRSVAGAALDASGNEGVLDVVAALCWVRQEVAAFGGDPGNVTVFGQSAGAIIISALFSMPAAKGLFHKAILQSSGTASQHLQVEAAAGLLPAILQFLGLTPAEAGTLRDLPAERLLELQPLAFPSPGYFPVVDGDVLPRSAYDAVRDGEAAGVPTIVGTVRDEDRLFELMDPAFPTLDEATLLARLETVVPGRGQEAIDTYRRERGERGEDTSPPALWTAMMTDRTYVEPAMRFAALQAAHAPQTYAYRFAWPSPSAFGTYHGLDLPFVWGVRTDPKFAPDLGDLDAAEVLSARIQDAWLGFARTGDPSHAGLPPWPGYEPASRATMIFAPTPEVRTAPREAERRFWERQREGQSPVG